MVIRFFDKETLTMKGEFSRFSKTSQTKYINAVGTFEVTADYLPEGLSLGDLLFAGGPECEEYWGEITQISGSVTASGETYTVKGREVLGLLTERIPISNGQPLSYTSTPREDIVKDLITQTFITPDNDDRAVQQFRVAQSLGRGTRVSFTAAPDKSVLDNALAVCKEPGFGVSIVPDYLTGVYLIDVVVPQTTDVVLSPKFDNLANEQFMISRATHKNVAYYGMTQDDITRYDCVGLSAGTGFGRKERWISASGDSEEAAVSTIVMQLGNFRPAESFTGDYQDSQTFTFGLDFKLGDYVSYAGAMGAQTAQLIGFTQTHEAGRYTRVLLFGDNLGATIRAITDIQKGG